MNKKIKINQKVKQKINQKNKKHLIIEQYLKKKKKI
jgi:hypothetical protein